MGVQPYEPLRCSRTLLVRTAPCLTGACCRLPRLADPPHGNLFIFFRFVNALVVCVSVYPTGLSHPSDPMTSQRNGLGGQEASFRHPGQLRTLQPLHPRGQHTPEQRQSHLSPPAQGIPRGAGPQCAASAPGQPLHRLQPVHLPLPAADQHPA